MSPILPELPEYLRRRAAEIKLLVMDVDGVLTDGRIFIRDNGEEIKAFHTLDGHGIKMLHQCGVQTAIITGRDAPSVAVRASSASGTTSKASVTNALPTPNCEKLPAWPNMNAPTSATTWWICP